METTSDDNLSLEPTLVCMAVGMLNPAKIPVPSKSCENPCMSTHINRGPIAENPPLLQI